MTKEKLAAELKDMYNNSLKGDATTMILLFGVKYAKELKECGVSMKEIAEFSEIGSSYQTEISKGIRLSKYDRLK